MIALSASEEQESCTSNSFNQFNDLSCFESGKKYNLKIGSSIRNSGGAIAVTQVKADQKLTIENGENNLNQRWANTFDDVQNELLRIST